MIFKRILLVSSLCILFFTNTNVMACDHCSAIVCVCCIDSAGLVGTGKSRHYCSHLTELCSMECGVYCDSLQVQGLPKCT